MKARTSLYCFAVVIAALTLSSCAHTPKATIGYYLPKSELSIKVTRTVACNKDMEPVVEVDVVPTTRFVADTSQRKEFDLSQLDNEFANTTAKFEFYEDGRLKGVNATSVGKGESILKSIVSIMPFMPETTVRNKTRFSSECEFIEKHGEKKALTIVYEGNVVLDKRTKTRDNLSASILKPALQVIEPVISSSLDHKGVSNMIGEICAVVLPATQVPPPLTINRGDKSRQLIMREPAITEVRIFSGDECMSQQYWAGQIVDAGHGVLYPLPVPRAATFGGTGFELAVRESGRLESLKYAKDTGVGESVNALGSVLGVLSADTDKDKAASLNAQADLIVAQQRMVRCRADPTTCK